MDGVDLTHLEIIMSNFNFIALLLVAMVVVLPVVQAEQQHIVDHVDLIIVDPQLSLSDLVTQTVEKYPDYALIAAMQQESSALHERGSRWISGAPQLQTYYKDDFAGSNLGAYEFDGLIQVPVWNWGQRDAGIQLAQQAEQSVVHKTKAIKLRVAGLVREALWAQKLEALRYEMSKKEFKLAEKLARTVQQRVDVGDLPKADFLLAESELLQKKAELINTEAELMHARKRYYFLTQSYRVPAFINEEKSQENSINARHPALAIMNATIAQKKAQVEWLKARGSGQTTVAVGGVTERGSRSDKTINSIAFTVNVPFGGAAYIAPGVAAATRVYVAAEADKAHTYRALLAQLHEAEHGLEVEIVHLELAKKLRVNAEQQLKIANLSFTAGELSLMDFLRLQARSVSAIKTALESDIRLQRNIALYNQAVGEMP